MKEKRWTNGAALEEAVAGYFRSISRTVTAEERGAPILNDGGEPIRYREYVVPPTVWGLCEYLGISRATWESYCDPRRRPGFRSAAALARDLMQDWSQRALLSRKDVRGLIYILQNAQEPAGEREEGGSLSLSRRRAILEEMGSPEE